MSKCWIFCSCPCCLRAMAASHAAADEACGRSWQCQCAACVMVRKESAKR